MQEQETKPYTIPYYNIPLEKFFQFGVSVDCVVFGYINNQLNALIIKRGAEPFKGEYALPGDLVYPNEPVDSAARRVLKELTGIHDLFLEQTHVYGQVDRHPLGRVITTGYYALIDISKHDPHAAAWADDLSWININELPELAFDHKYILQDALIKLRAQLRHEPIAFELLPEKFTLGELQQFYEGMLGTNYDKANFRKKMLSLKILIETNELQKDVPHRPAKLFTLNKDLKNIKSYAFDL